MQFIYAALLLSGSVLIHAQVLGLVLDRLSRLPALPTSAHGHAWLLVRVAAATILAHLLEITVWAVFYVWKGILPDFEVAYYLSAVTYATIGYGDVVPPHGWRILVAIEGLTGILLCGWSAGFFFAVVNRAYAALRERRAKG